MNCCAEKLNQRASLSGLSQIGRLCETSPRFNFPRARFVVSALGICSLIAWPTVMLADVVYVSNYRSQSIVSFTPDGTGSVFATSVPAPEGLAFDKAGNLYAASDSASTVTKLTPEGLTSVFANTGIHFPQALDFDELGNLYAANTGFIESFTTGGVASKFANTGAVAGLAFDGAGNLYAASSSFNSVLKITPAGVISTFITTGLFGPTGLAFDEAGNLYVANVVVNQIKKFTPAGVGSIFAQTGLSAPVGLAFDSAGNLYVANNGNNTIEKFTPQGVGSVFASTDLDAPVWLAVIPEPSVLALVGVATPLMLVFRSRNQTAKN